LTGLTDWLHDVREERKAILAVTDGWQLYKSDGALLNRRPAPPPAIGTIAGTGRPAIAPDPATGPIDSTACERYRTELAYFDGEQQYRLLLDRANRANASFYPVHPQASSSLRHRSARRRHCRWMWMAHRASARGFDAHARGRDRRLAIISNDLERVLRRVVGDLSSYYLLGYYSSGKLDGRFHPISVRVKRPVFRSVRDEATWRLRPRQSSLPIRRRRSTWRPWPRLRRLRRLPIMRASCRCGSRPRPGGSQARNRWPRCGSPASSVASRSSATPGRAERWWTRSCSRRRGSPVATASATIAAGARSFKVALTPREPLPEGDYVLRVGARSGAAVIPSRESLRLHLPAAPNAAGAIWIRRGPATANREVPTADLRFRRSEQVRVEIPTLASAPGRGRLLDRTGKELPAPVTAAIRDDADGSRWITAQLALAALAPGDYIMELAEGEKRMLTAFRVIP
jgi:hypothetical protein